MNAKTNNEIERTYQGLSKLLYEFNLDFDEVCKTLRENYVLESFKHCKTITRTSLKIGIDRRTVSAIINNKEQYHRPSSIFTILSRIKTIAQENDSFINKTGVNSIDSIISEVANGSTTLKSVVNELISLGCIEEKEGKIKFITSHISKTPNKQRTLQIFSNHIDRYVDTVIHNLNCKNHEDKRFEYSIYSTKIPPSKTDELQKQTRKILKNATDKLLTVYEKFDQDVPTGTYEEIGVSLTQFNLNNKKEEKQ